MNLHPLPFRPWHAAISLLLVVGPALLPAQTVFSGSGSTTTDSSLTTSITNFRTQLGALNANSGAAFASGRREINWDGVPDSASAPNAFPGDFFGQAFTGANGGRARGLTLSAPTGGLLNSANNPGPLQSTANFSDFLAGSGITFTPFSGDQLFVAPGSTVMDATFSIAGSPSNVGYVRGFGAVFLGVEAADTTSLEFFGVNGASLGRFFAPTAGVSGFSFLGVSFDPTVGISRVRITSGSETLNAFGAGSNLRQSTGDLVVLDDFIYSEPLSATAIPEPSTYAAIFGACALFGVVLHRRRRATGTAS